jgi:hypothetical protein
LGRLLGKSAAMSSTIAARAMLLSFLMVRVVQAQSGPLTIHVEVKTDVEHKYKKIRGERKYVQAIYTRRLEVTVKNLGPKKLAQVAVKQYLFVRDVGMNTIEVVGMGEGPVDLPAMRSVVTVGKPAQVTHRVQDDAGGKFVGYAVQVWQGPTLLGDLCEPKDMRAKFEKAIADAPNSVERWAAVEKKLHKGKKKKAGD